MSVLFTAVEIVNRFSPAARQHFGPGESESTSTRLRSGRQAGKRLTLGPDLQCVGFFLNSDIMLTQASFESTDSDVESHHSSTNSPQTSSRRRATKKKLASNSDKNELRLTFDVCLTFDVLSRQVVLDP